MQLACWSDYYTTWSAGFLVLVVMLELCTLGRLRSLIDAACINSLAVGIVGAFINAVVPPDEDPLRCHQRRAPLNAALHALPAAYATVVLLKRRVQTTPRHLVAILLTMQLIYFVWPSKLSASPYARCQRAYGIKCPFAWAGVLWGFIAIFAYAARAPKQ